MYKRHVNTYRQSTKTFSYKISRIRKIHTFLPEVHIISDVASKAFSLGFVDRKIYISELFVSKLSTKELEAVLLHEYKHVRDFDSLKLFVAFVIETALTFIPSMKTITVSMRIDREIEADRFAASVQKTNKYLLSSLKKVLDPIPAVEHAFVTQFAPGELLDARVAALTSSEQIHNPPASFARFLVSLLSFLVLSYLALAPVHATEVLINGKTSVMACAETSPQCLATCEMQASQMSKKD